MNPCMCVRCPDCRGTGNGFFDMSGRYVGHGMTDDTDEIESCPSCRGGIVEVCANCQTEEDEDYYA